jgi:tetratricopeptide (TPR) repeat protein
MPVPTKNQGKSETPAMGIRLDSWKEIAAYLRRSERTVKRWEQERGLPTHRLPGKGRSSVFAYASELDEWLKSAQVIDTTEPDDSGLQVVAQPEAEVGELVSFFQYVKRAGNGLRRTRRIALVTTLLVGLVLGTEFWEHRHTSSASAFSIPGMAPERAAPVPGTSNAEKQLAHELYLKGIYEWNKRTPESLERALDLFTQAVVHDPGSAKSFAGMAETYLLMREYSPMPDAEAYSRALAASRKAVELDDSLAEAHRCLAYAEVWGLWNFEDGEKEFRRAIELDPRDPLAHLWFANAFHGPGWYTVSLHEIDRAQELDPGSSAILADKGMLLFESGQKHEGLEMEQQVERTDSVFLKPHYFLARMYWYLRDYPEFLQESQQVASLKHDPVLAETNAAANAGFRRDGERGLLTDLQAVQKRLAAEGKLNIGLLATTYVRMGERAEAVRLLREEFDNHLDEFPYARQDLDLLTLNDEPGFRELIDRLHVPNPPTIAEIDASFEADRSNIAEGKRP